MSILDPIRHGAHQRTFPEKPVSILGKPRVIGHWVRQIKATDPAIREVQMHLFAKPSL